MIVLRQEHYTIHTAQSSAYSFPLSFGTRYYCNKKEFAYIGAQHHKKVWGIGTAGFYNCFDIYSLGFWGQGVFVLEWTRNFLDLDERYRVLCSDALQEGLVRLYFLRYWFLHMGMRVLGQGKLRLFRARIGT